MKAKASVILALVGALGLAGCSYKPPLTHADQVSLATVEACRHVVAVDDFLPWVEIDTIPRAKPFNEAGPQAMFQSELARDLTFLLEDDSHTLATLDKKTLSEAVDSLDGATLNLHFFLQAIDDDPTKDRAGPLESLVQEVKASIGKVNDLVHGCATWLPENL